MFRLVARQRAGREDAGHNGPDVLSEGFFFRAVEEGFRRGGDEVHFALCVVHHDAFVDGVEDGSEARGALAFGPAGAGDVDRLKERPLGGYFAVDDLKRGEPRCGGPLAYERPACDEELHVGGVQLDEPEVHLVFGAVKVFLDSHAKGFFHAGETGQRGGVPKKRDVADMPRIGLERLQEIPCGEVDGHDGYGGILFDDVHGDAAAEDDVAGIRGEAFCRFDGLIEGQIHEFDAAAQIFGDLSENPGIKALVGRDEGHLKFVLREHLFSPCALPRSPAPGCEG